MDTRAYAIQIKPYKQRASNYLIILKYIKTNTDFMKSVTIQVISCIQSIFLSTLNPPPLVAIFQAGW